MSIACIDPAFEVSAVDGAAAQRAADDARVRLADALIRVGDLDHRAFREVYTLTSAKLFGICLRICGERSAAEDVLHNVYLTIWRRAGTWEPGRSSPITWLATIARNRAIDWRRGQRHPTTAPWEETAEPIDPGADPEAAASARQDQRHLLSCLARLDARQADAIRTAFFEGLTYAELARRQGVPLATMKSCIRRGLAALRRQMDAAAP